MEVEEQQPTKKQMKNPKLQNLFGVSDNTESLHRPVSRYENDNKDGGEFHNKLRRLDSNRKQGFLKRLGQKLKAVGKGSPKLSRGGLKKQSKRAPPGFFNQASAQKETFSIAAHF